MNSLFLLAASIYVTASLTAAVGALTVTVWAYNVDDRMLSDLVTAAIINTAAAVAAMGFFGGFDMIFTIWQFLRNQEAEKSRNQEREEERKAREEERRVREEERKAREEERDELMSMLRAEHQRSAELTARVMELSEIAINRANGREESSRGE